LGQEGTRPDVEPHRTACLPQFFILARKRRFQKSSIDRRKQDGKPTTISLRILCGQRSGGNLLHQMATGPIERQQRFKIGRPSVRGGFRGDTAAGLGTGRSADARVEITRKNLFDIAKSSTCEFESMAVCMRSRRTIPRDRYKKHTIRRSGWDRNVVKGKVRKDEG